jgi:hypothetical protein
MLKYRLEVKVGIRYRKGRTWEREKTRKIITH